jgi:drug/metabolite transporter (DMT)-like permease
MGVALSAAACFDGATVFQAMEARQLRSHTMRPSLLAQLARRPRWLAAATLALAGVPLQLAALSLAPLTLVQPTLALGVLLLLFLGSRYLNEPVGRRELLATAAIIAGVVGIALSAPPYSDQYTTGPKLWVVLGALAAVAALPYLAGRSNERVGGLLVVGAGAAFATSAFLGKLIVDELSAGRIWRALAWAAAAGISILVGVLSEMSGIQGRAVSRVAPPIFVIETVVPVLCAPLLTGEHWSGTPLGGGVIAISLVAVAAGGATLGRTRAVEELVAASHEQAPEPAAR